MLQKINQSAKNNNLGVKNSTNILEQEIRKQCRIYTNYNK